MNLISGTSSLADMSGNADDMQKPLLMDDDGLSVQEEIAQTSVVPTRRLQFLAALTGALLAYLSQIALCAMLWTNAIFEDTRTEIILFSLQWSLWTCLLVFSGMLAFLRLVQSRAATPISETSILSLETYYVVGALLSITSTWLYKDLLEEGSVLSRPCATLGLLIPSYILLADLLLQQPQHQSSTLSKSTISNNSCGVMPTYRLVSCILGLVVGVGSQFVLGLFLWKDRSMKDPVIGSVIYFSLLWSGCTVAITFLACFSLRIFSSPISSTLGFNSNEPRTLLRMESTYISSSLVGICGAWIFIDWMSGLNDQVLPSIVMLNLSLFCFQIILRCFPEDQCLDVLDDNTTETQDDVPLLQTI